MALSLETLRSSSVGLQIEDGRDPFASRCISSPHVRTCACATSRHTRSSPLHGPSAVLRRNNIGWELEP